MIFQFPLSVMEQLASNFSQNQCQLAAFANLDSIDMFCFLCIPHSYFIFGVEYHLLHSYDCKCSNGVNYQFVLFKEY